MALGVSASGICSARECTNAAIYRIDCNPASPRPHGRGGVRECPTWRATSSTARSPTGLPLLAPDGPSNRTFQPQSH